MSEQPKRKKPSELALVASTEAGEVLEVAPYESGPEQVRRERLEGWRARTYTGREILERMSPREWLVKDWLPKHGLVSLYAPSGKGKSFVALTMALEVARGGSWAGEPLEAHTVLYVAAERALDQRDRFEAWLEHYEVQDLETFTLLDSAPQLTDPLAVLHLCEYIRETGSKVVVLDTFARMTLGMEENSSRELGPVMEAVHLILEATEGGLVLVVHHTGKDTSKGARGSTAYLAALDVGMTLEGDMKALKVKVEKANAGAAPLPEWLRFEQVALPEIEPGGPKRLSGVLVPTLARDAGADLDPVVVKVLTEQGALTRKALGEAIAEDLGTEEPSRATLGKVLKRLEESGTVRALGAATSPNRRYEVARLYPTAP